MTDLMRWDPFEEMTSLRDAMNQLVAESFVRPYGMAGTFQPAVDLYETEHEYVVKLAAPGLKPDNFDITMQQNMLTIQGRTQDFDQMAAQDLDYIDRWSPGLDLKIIAATVPAMLRGEGAIASGSPNREPA